MNSRDYRVFREGCYFHIYNRGNNKELTYYDDSDYVAFLMRTKMLLGHNVSKGAFAMRGSRIRVTPFTPADFTIISYCLMPNHFHFLIRQNGEVGIDQFMLRLLTSYSKYFNTKHERIGNVFQDRFKAKLVDSDRYAMYLSAYIHNNPENPETWPYSSYPDYCQDRSGAICDKSLILSFFQNGAGQYRNFVAKMKHNNPIGSAYLFEEEE